MPPSNMSVPGYSGAMGVVGDLGLGGALNAQVADETEEMRRKRMLEARQRSLLGPAGSPAAMSLFGGMGAYGR